MKHSKRLTFGLAVLMLCCIATVADAHGILRRLFSRPRVVCEPQPICMSANSPVQPVLIAQDTLEGRITLVGPMPKLQDYSAMAKRSAEMINILPNELIDPTWRIDPKTRGVANVCVYIKRPKDGKLFIKDEDKKRSDSIVIDTPRFMYLPHMVAYYPEWFDGKDRGETGHRFLIRNTSPVGHNNRLTGHPKHNEGFNRNQPRNTEFNFTELGRSQKVNPQPLPLTLQSDIYPWMQAYIWAFDHPYFAITKEDGTFAIARVPVGMELQVMAWHESQGWLFTKESKTMTLKAGKNVLDFTIKAP